MALKQKAKHRKSKTILIAAVLVILAAGGAAGYYFWGRQTPVQAQAGNSSGTQTTVVRQGDLVISALGSGTLTAGQTADLSFPISGTLAELNVQVGDKVEQGQVLAVLDDLASLQAKVNTAQLDLISVQKVLDDLQTNSVATLAQAQLDLATAQKAAVDAYSEIKTTDMARCDDDTTLAYYEQYLYLSQQYEKMQANGWNAKQYIEMVKPVVDEMNRYFQRYNYCIGYTDYEINSSQATLAKTQAELTAAQAHLDLLQANNGIDPDELAVAQNNVDTAQLALNQAKKNLDGATMKAPFAGTILSVAGKVGDSVGTATFITLADLTHPNVAFYVDETDMDKLALGYPVIVTFDALPDLTFSGEVIQISPQLTSYGNSQTLAGVASLDLGDQAETLNLPEGLNASVEIVAGEAQGALLVPVEALRDLGDGAYAVFKLGEDGQPRLTTVTVGLNDFTYAQITSGLQAGDVVTTGIVEVN